jgi:hypothetical protein
VNVTYYGDDHELEVVPLVGGGLEPEPVLVDESVWPLIAELVARHGLGRAVVRSLARGHA